MLWHSTRVAANRIAYSFRSYSDNFWKISIKIVQIDHKLAVSINAEHKHIPAQVEINLPGYQSLPVKN